MRTAGQGSRCQQRAARQLGFTIVELIVVMVILGILGSVAAVRFFDRQGFDAASFSDQGSALVRYAQKIAIAQNRPVLVRLNGNSIALCFDAACASRVTAAGGSNSGGRATLANCNGATTWACEGLPNGLAYTVTPNIGSFFFDANGEPFAANDNPTGMVSTFASTRIRVTFQNVNHDINVTAVTGYVN